MDYQPIEVKYKYTGIISGDVGQVFQLPFKFVMLYFMLKPSFDPSWKVDCQNVTETVSFLI